MYQHNKWFIDGKYLWQFAYDEMLTSLANSANRRQQWDWQDSIQPTVQQQNEVTVRCNPLVNWRLFGRNKPIRTTKGIYTSDKTKQSVQTRIYTLSSVKNVVTSCESLQLRYRVTPYNNKNSSRDLKGRETRKQGTQPQQSDSWNKFVFLPKNKVRVSWLLTLPFKIKVLRVWLQHYYLGAFKSKL